MHCKKTCWSAECLAGMRCEWCGVTVCISHAPFLHVSDENCLPVSCVMNGLAIPTVGGLVVTLSTLETAWQMDVAAS